MKKIASVLFVVTLLAGVCAAHAAAVGGREAGDSNAEKQHEHDLLHLDLLSPVIKPDVAAN
jgi:hypothetical protein